jgi:membrane protein DedA with SNARE-associated domain
MTDEAHDAARYGGRLAQGQAEMDARYEAVLERFGRERVARARRAFDRFDILALAVPALLPAPMPFKIFVLTAAVLGMPRRRFAFTLLLARGVRYTAWAALGVAYGEEGMRLLQRFDAWFAAHARAIGLSAVLVLVLVVAWRVISVRRRPQG